MLNTYKSKVLCRIDVCKKRHHTLLHNPKYINENKDPNKAAANEHENEGKNQNSHMHNHNCFGNKFNLLHIILVILSNNTNNI